MNEIEWLKRLNARSENARPFACDLTEPILAQIVHRSRTYLTWPWIVALVVATLATTSAVWSARCLQVQAEANRVTSLEIIDDSISSIMMRVLVP
jgi:hypothetical protein